MGTGLEVIGWLVFATSMAMSVAQMTLPKSSKQSTEKAGQKVNTCDSERTLPIVYGKARIGINRVYCGTSGSENQYLHIIGTICEGPVNGIATSGGVPQIWLNDKLYTEYGANVHYEFFTGTATQSVCSTLHSAIPSWNDPLHYTCYIYLRLEFDQDKFQSLPDVTVLVEGLKVYNASTAVTEYSNNPAWCLWDFLTRPTQRGGMGIDSGRLDTTTWTDAASYCTTKEWTCNLALTGDSDASEYISDILATFRGCLLYSMTEFLLKYRDMNYESSVMSITEDDLVSQSLTITQPDVFNTPNAIEISYINDDKRYNQDTYVYADQDAITSDGGDYRPNKLTMLGLLGETVTQKMAYYWLERLRQNKTASMSGAQRLLALDPMDLVTLTHSRYGWDDKYFRVTETSCSPDGNIAVQLIEEDLDFYDDVYNLTDRTWHDTYLCGPDTAIPSVYNVSLTEELYDYRGRTFTRLKLDFDPPPVSEYPFFDYAEVWVRVGAGGDWKYMTRATTDYMLDPVQEGEEYGFKLVGVSIFGTKQTENEAYALTHTVLGKTEVPSSIPSFSVVVAGDTVTIRATALTEADIAGYELRMGAAWDGGLFCGFNETPNFRFVGVRPGTHTFWLAAKGNNGYYSATPASATAIVYYPPGYADIATYGTWAWDYDGIGTHDNTEHVTYESVDALKCSHTGGVLVGTWLSPEYDMGSVMTARYWGDFLTDFVVSTASWDAIFSTYTWEDRIGSTTRWDNLIAVGEQGKIEATIHWGDTTGNLTNSADGFELLAAEFSARYVQVEVTITDPNTSSNLYLYTLNMKAAYWS